MPTFNQPYSITLPLPLSVDTDTPVADPQFEADDWQISYDFDPTNPDAATWQTAVNIPVVISGNARLVLSSNEIGEHLILHARLKDSNDPEQWLDTIVTVFPSSSAVEDVVNKINGPGSNPHCITVNSQGIPIAGVECWVSTDESGENVVAGTKSTDDFGEVTFLLNSGEYFLWRDSSEFEFPNPTRLSIDE